MSLMELRAVSRHFDVSSPWLLRKLRREPRRSLTAVQRVSLQLEKGETYALVGESGSGKSTIASLMVGLLAPSEGEILLDGRPLTATAASSSSSLKPQSRLQMVFQSPYASLNPRWRVQAIIEEPLRAYGLGLSAEARRARVAEVLEQVGLSAEDAHKFPHEFSGGQRQRISIARVLASEPELIVCDEPTSALDVSVQAQVLNLLTELQRELQLTYLFITHDLAVVRQIAHRVGVLYLGELVEEQSVEMLFTNPQHPYTHMLLAAAPRMDGFGREFEERSATEIPDPIQRPSGCAFHPRCPLAVAECRTEVPPIKMLETGYHRCRCASAG